MLETKKDHKYDVPGETEFRFKKAPLIVDDKSKIAMSEEPLKGAWNGAPDLYPGSLVPSATRHRWEDREPHHDLTKHVQAVHAVYGTLHPDLTVSASCCAVL